MDGEPTRFFALLPRYVRPEGECPACGGIMAETGCWTEFDRGVKPEPRERTGIARIIEVYCYGEDPVAPVEPCPTCEEQGGDSGAV